MSDQFENFKNTLPEFVKDETDFQLYKLRHSAEHVFAQALTSLFPEKIKLAVAHISEDGFANDASWEITASEEMLSEIEAKMQEIIDRNLPITREEVSVDEAKEIFKNNPFKLEWLEQWAAQDKNISIYRTGDEYVDLCKGPHVDSTGEIKAF